jgi:hypothetical protein
VAARAHLLGGVDDHLGATTAALQGDHTALASAAMSAAPEPTMVPVSDARSPDSWNRLVETGLGPLVAAEQADEHAGGRAELDVGRAATGAPVDTVVEALVARVDVVLVGGTGG